MDHNADQPLPKQQVDPVQKERPVVSVSEICPCYSDKESAESRSVSR